jgi:hypothetical protein
MPDLSNATAGGIVDMCAPDQAEYNRLDKLTKYYKAGLKARLTEDMRIDVYTHIVRGENFTAVISEKTRTGFSVARAVELGYLTQEQIEECMVTGEPYQECRFAPNEKTDQQLKQEVAYNAPSTRQQNSDTLTAALKESLKSEGVTE